ncbi:hypothetical protein R5R35_002774 [Gryllus longicercus]|uniref:G-protein coupled receptors family 2 profile 2 domain-containing protein n=1 Tax=Gryllus longicercus TaxID=2509291 RepID=A0AAN9ZG14_9ORTH
MVNTLRACSHLYGDEPEICLNFALSVYFFLVAANVWVNVLTLDIADGLRRPLHERAVGDTGRWKRTIFFSIYAWGFAAVLTSFAAHAEFNPQSTLPKPTYLETRTCRFEECGTLFLVNLAIYAYLAIRLDQLNADSEMVDEQAMNDSAPAHRSGTIFFRLLMMMGTIEWVVEFTMWGLRGKFRTTEYLEKYKRFATIEDEHQSQTEFRIAGVVLDALRAASVAWVCCGRPRVRKRLGESVRRTLRRPLRLASALSSSAAASSSAGPDPDPDPDPDQHPRVGSRAIKFLRRSARRLRSWPQRVKPQPPQVGRSLSEEPATASAAAASSPAEHIEMRTFSVASLEDSPPPSPAATSGV